MNCTPNRRLRQQHTWAAVSDFSGGRLAICYVGYFGPLPLSSIGDGVQWSHSTWSQLPPVPNQEDVMVTIVSEDEFT